MDSILNITADIAETNETCTATFAGDAISYLANSAETANQHSQTSLDEGWRKAEK